MRSAATGRWQGGACDWQDDAYVPGCFAKNRTIARKLYLADVKAGIDLGRRPELVGGGLIRSLGGWFEVKKLRLIRLIDQDSWINKAVP